MSLVRRHDGEDDIDGGDDEIEKTPAAKKARKTLSSPANDFLLLDRLGYEDQSNDAGGSTSTWTAPMVTSLGMRFQVSLRPESPPSISRLLFKAIIPADILTYNKYDSTLHLIVTTSSGDGALLHESRCAGATNYYVMDHLLDDGRHPALTRLQEMPPGTMIWMNMGLMRRRRGVDGDSYAVAALEQKTSNTDRLVVVFLSTSANVWRRKPVRVPGELLRDGDYFLWEPAASLTCGGRFWWVDLQRGLLSCPCDSLLLVEGDDDAQQRPLDLDFTLLPGVTMVQAKMADLSKYPLAQDRCVGVSGGRLRFVEVSAHRRSRSTSSPVAPPPLCEDCHGGTVTSWVLEDHGGGAAWTKEHTVKVADVWRDESYGSTGLPKEPPEFPLVHPLDPDMIYLSIIGEGRDRDGREFCVHLGTKVRSCSSSYNTLDFKNPVVNLMPVLTRRA